MKNKLIKFILSFTDYDKLKEKNEELKRDIYILIERQGEVEYFHVISRHKFKYTISKLMWGGDVIMSNRFDGIFNKLSNENKNKQ